MSQPLNSIAVFCGASPGLDACYMDTAFVVGQTIAESGAGLIYGGGRTGLMGAVADGALHAGGKVTGVLPHFLRTKEIAHCGLTELIIVGDMHERKLRMHELSNAIIALPGGWGTMEELMEMLTWAQLGLHRKPIGLLNINGFYDGLVQLISTMQESGFLRPALAGMLIIRDDIQLLLEAMRAYEAPVMEILVTEEEV
jgi:uncharacterized protein (TIGR00730 family)